MLNEVWKDCKHYEGLYQVSNYGRVRSVERDVVERNGKVKHIEQKYKTQRDNGRGYLYVTLYKFNHGKREYVHRLVAMAFIPNPENKPTVNHKDEDKQNNYVENLEWMTYQENNNYGSHNENATNTRRKNGVFERQRKRWIEHNPTKENPKIGVNNPCSKKVICNGLIFDCIKDCAEHFNIDYATFRGYLCGSKRTPKHFIDMGLRYAD